MQCKPCGGCGAATCRVKFRKADGKYRNATQGLLRSYEAIRAALLLRRITSGNDNSPLPSQTYRKVGLHCCVKGAVVVASAPLIQMRPEIDTPN